MCSIVRLLQPRPKPFVFDLGIPFFKLLLRHVILPNSWVGFLNTWCLGRVGRDAPLVCVEETTSLSSTSSLSTFLSFFEKNEVEAHGHQRERYLRPKKMQVVIAMSGRWSHMDINGKEREAPTFMFITLRSCSMYIYIYNI